MVTVKTNLEKLRTVLASLHKNTCNQRLNSIPFYTKYPDEVSHNNETHREMAHGTHVIVTFITNTLLGSGYNIDLYLT